MEPSKTTVITTEEGFTMAEERVYDIEFDSISMIVEQAIEEYGANNLTLQLEPGEGGFLVQLTYEHENNSDNDYLSTLSSSLPYLEALDRSLKLADQYHLRWAPN